LSKLPVARLTSIRKSFASTQAVDGVDLEIFPGEVHALVGENGAGKSTLMRVLAGFYPDYQGRIEIAGKQVRIAGVRQAKRLGIALVHQELSLVPELSVAENIFLGDEPSSPIPGFISRKKSRDQASALLREIGVNLDPKQKISRLSVAYRQLVEIAKGLSTKPRVLILDEPSSSLTSPEIKELFKVIRRLVELNTAIIYISHKLEEVFEIADRITVMRDGKKIATDIKAQWNQAKLIQAMVGREFSSLFPHNHQPDYKNLALQAINLSRLGAFKNVSLQLFQGEVLGIYGLIGAGRSQLAESLFGLVPARSGEIRIFGKSVKINSSWAAKRLGIALVPEDRRGRGLVLMHSIGKNLSLPNLKYFSSLGFVRPTEEKNESQRIVKEFGIQAASLAALSETLSGGNQQKLVIGKWLMRPPRILILDEPTRGIDVGAKAEVHSLIDRLAGQGMAILLISSELPEILGMSDRVLAMREGEMVCEYQRQEANAENLGAAAAGVCL